MPPNRALSSMSWRDRANAEHAYRQQQQLSPYSEGVQDTANLGSASVGRIYVGNMPYTAQRADVAQLFEDEGIEITNIDISIDRFTSRNPSYCFVDFQNAEAAALAMRTLSGKIFLGRPLKVKPCVEKRSRSHLRHSDRLESSRWGSSSSERTVRQHREGSNSASPPAALPLPMQEKRRLYVGNLPRPADNHASDLEIRDIFKDYCVEAVSKVKWPGHCLTRDNGWYAFVDLSTAEEAQSASRQLDSRTVLGGELIVRLASGVPEKVGH